MHKRILSAILTCALVLGLVPAYAMADVSPEEYDLQTEAEEVEAIPEEEAIVTEEDIFADEEVAIDTEEAAPVEVELAEDTAQAAEDEEKAELAATITGYCSNDNSLGWSLTTDGSQGTLSIYPAAETGTFTMNDYIRTAPAPWFAYTSGLDKVSVIVEDGVKSIGEQAFTQIGGAPFPVRSLTLGKDVESIGNEAFYYCPLSEITFADAVYPSLTLGESCFYGTNLTNVVLPEGISRIEQSAFGDIELAAITLPNTLSFIGSSIFDEVSNVSYRGLKKDLLAVEGASENYYIKSFADQINYLSVTFTGPSARKLTYTGGKQTLLSKGSATYGTFEYSVDGGAYSTALPKKTNAGTYKVDYRLVARTGRVLAGPNPVTASIAKVTPIVTAPKARSLYEIGASQTLVSGGATDVGTLKYCLTKTGTYSTTAPKGKTAGTYRVYYKVYGDTNVNSTKAAYVDVTIKKAIKYNIKYSGNKATSGSMTAMSGCYYSKAYTLTANAFKRSGYTFKGWNTKADGSGTAYANSASVKNLTKTNGATVTLYAQWSKKKYTITYNVNGGTNPSENPASYTISSEIALKSPVKTGYAGAWYKESTFKTKVTSIVKGTTGNLTLYAKYAPYNYSIAFQANGGKGSMSTIAAKYDAAVTLPANAFTRDDYIFKGWATSASGDVVYKNKASVKNLTSKNKATVTLYAVWEEEGATGFTSSDYSVTSGQIYTYIEFTLDKNALGSEYESIKRMYQDDPTYEVKGDTVCGNRLCDTKTYTFTKLPGTLSELKQIKMDNKFDPVAAQIVALTMMKPQLTKPTIYDADKGIPVHRNWQIMDYLMGPDYSPSMSQMQNYFGHINGMIEDNKLYAYFDGATSVNNYTPSKPLSFTFVESPYYLKGSKNVWSGEEIPDRYMILIKAKDKAFDNDRYIDVYQNKADGKYYCYKDQWIHMLIDIQ